MRALIVLSLLATSVYGDLSGYAYGAGSSGSLGNIGLALNGEASSLNYGSLGSYGSGHAVESFGNSGLSSGAGLGSAGLASFGAPQYVSSGSIGSIGSGHAHFGNAGSASSGLIGSSGYSGSNGALNFGGNFAGQQQPPVNTAPVELEVVKEFYTFEAPEGEFQQQAQLNRMRNILKKHQTVVFIKTPENKALEQAAFSLVNSAVESKNDIYVLHKQADLAKLSNQLSVVSSHKAHKPEVHFVKYNTPEDAINAQRTIQAHYDSLGGATSHKAGGVPRVLNFATNYAPAYSRSDYSTEHGNGHGAGFGNGGFGSSVVTEHGHGAGFGNGGFGSSVVSGGSGPSKGYLPSALRKVNSSNRKFRRHISENAIGILRSTLKSGGFGPETPNTSTGLGGTPPKGGHMSKLAAGYTLPLEHPGGGRAVALAAAAVDAAAQEREAAREREAAQQPEGVYSLSQLNIVLTEQHVSNNRWVEITCLSTIPSAVGQGEQYADYKTYSVKVEVELPEVASTSTVAPSIGAAALGNGGGGNTGGDQSSASSRMQSATQHAWLSIGPMLLGCSTVLLELQRLTH